MVLPALGAAEDIEPEVMAVADGDSVEAAGEDSAAAPLGMELVTEVTIAGTEV